MPNSCCYANNGVNKRENDGTRLPSGLYTPILYPLLSISLIILPPRLVILRWWRNPPPHSRSIPLSLYPLGLSSRDRGCALDYATTLSRNSSPKPKPGRSCLLSVIRCSVGRGERRAPDHRRIKPSRSVADKLVPEENSPNRTETVRPLAGSKPTIEKKK